MTRRRWLEDVERPRRRPRPVQVPADAEDLPVVPFIPVRCPNCGGLRKRTSTYPAKGRRYHVCKDCGQRFRSEETTPDGLQGGF